MLQPKVRTRLSYSSPIPCQSKGWYATIRARLWDSQGLGSSSSPRSLGPLFPFYSAWRTTRGPQPFCFLRPVLLLVLFLQSAFGQAIYLPNPGSSTVSAYVMNPLTGALTPVAGSPFLTGTTPVQALVHPNGKFLYVLDGGAQDITAYSISAPSGVLTNIPCPLCSAVFPTAMAITPAGDVLVVASATSSTLTGYSINSNTGALTKGPSVNSASSPTHLAFDPSGRYLYVANFGTSQITGYAVGSGGFLTAVPGSPFPAGSGTRSVAVSSNAVFAANQNSADVYVYRMGSDGSLVQAGIPVPAGGSPSSIVIDPSGSFIYVANGIQVVPFFNVPSPPYPITPVTPASVDISPAIVAVEPSGRFVFVADSITTTVSAFSIGANGALLPLGDVSTFGTRGVGWMAASHIGDTTSISLSPGFPNPSGSAQFGATVEFKGRVADILNPGGIPKGSVSFQLNGAGAPIGAAALDSLGGFDFNFNGSTAFLPIGSFFMRILYNPGAGFEAPIPLDTVYTVTPAAPSFTIGYSPAAPVATQAMTINVSSQQAGGRFPSGSVSISVDATVVGSVALINGSASISFVPTTGDHSISIAYSGDSFFLAARPAPLTFHAKHPTTTVLTSNSATPVYGEAPVFTATVASGGFISGSVDFFDGATDLGTAAVVLSGSAYTAQLSTYRFISLGQHFLTAVYSGDGNNLPSNNNSAPLTLNVSRDGVTVSTPVSSGTLQYGNPVTFTAGVAAASPGSGTPTGNLNFQEGATSLGSPKLASGSAAFTTSTLLAGQHTITASYPGDANFLSASVAGLLVTIAQATPLVTVSTTPSSASVSGQQITISASLSHTPTATGSVDFNINGAKIGSTVLANNLASLPYTPATAGPYSISVNYKGDSNNVPADGSSSLTVNKDAVKVSAPSASGTLIVGQPVTFTTSVSAAPPGAGSPGGSIVVREGPTVQGSGTIAAGSANVAISTLAVGAHTLVASYGGDSNFLSGDSDPVLVTIAQASPSLAISSQPASSSVVGQPITITASLSQAFSPAGSVDFFVKGSKIGSSALSGTSASFSFTPSAAGSYSVSAVYQGDTNNTSANGSATLVVNQAPVNVSTPSVSGNLTAGQSLTFAVAVSAAAPGAGAPTGTVSLREGSTVLASATIAGGSANFTISSLTAGVHVLDAMYRGDSNFLSGVSTSTATVTLAKATPALTLSPLPVSAVVGQSVNLTAALSSGASPTGTIAFSAKGSVLGSATLTGSAASFPFSPTTAGSYDLTATYAGDSNNAASSGGITLIVGQAAVNVSTPSTSGALVVGQSLTLTSTVSVAAPGNGNPTGNITFTEGGSTVGVAPLVLGTANLTTSSLSVGSHTITATYSGDANFATGSSRITSVVVDRATPVLAITVDSPSAPISGQAVTIKTALTGIVGTPFTGSMTLTDNGTLVTASPMPVTAGQAQFGPYVLTGSGGHLLAATYSGDAIYKPVTSTSTMAVNRATVSVHATSSSSVATYQKPVSLSAAVSATPPGSGLPTGVVSWMEGSTVIGSAPLAGGVATLTISSLAVGDHSLVLAYQGDSNFLPDSSAKASITVVKAVPSLSLAASPTSGLITGQTVTLTVSVSNAIGATGSLNFWDETGAISSNSVPLSQGSAMVSYTPAAAGVHTIVVQYSGDGNYMAADNRSSPLTLTVKPASTLVSTPSMIGSTQVGQPLTLVSSVSVAQPGSGSPTGAVAFQDGKVALGTASLVGGSATITLSSLPAGPHSVTASYAGDPNFSAANSSALVFSQNRGITSTAVSAQQNATSTVLSAYVRAIGGSAPTGYAQFLNGANSLGTVALTPVDQTSSIGTLSVPTVSGVITAFYLGDINFNSSTSAAITLSSTAKLPVTIGISSSLAVIGQPVGLTAVLSWTGGGTPTGTIQFFEGQTLLATVPAKAVSTVNIPLSAGPHNIVGMYSGDSTYLPASINYVLQVSKNIPAISLSVDQTSIVAGQAATFTVNLTPQGPSGAPFPTGQLQLTEVGTVLGSAAINHAAVTIALTALSPGVHMISGAYAGDDSWGPVVSNPFSITVSKAATATSIHTTADSAESADIDVEATVSVIAPGAGTPTGMVQFIDSVSSQVLGSARLLGGIATATIPATSMTATIIATYSGDARFTGSSSAPVAQFAILNSASFQTSILAPDEIVTVFGAGLSNVTASAQFPLPYSLGGVTLTLTDSSGLGRPALLLYVSPGQLSFIVPGQSAPGPATLQIAAANGNIYSVAVTVASVSPGLFTANSTGKGAAAAQTIRVHPDGSQDPPQTVAAYDSVAQTWSPAPIDVSSPGDSLFLILYGTGIRHGTSSLTVTIGGQTLAPLYTGAQGTFPGLDQVNVQLPASLAGSGLVTVTVMIDGQSSNPATLYFK